MNKRTTSEIKNLFCKRYLPSHITSFFNQRDVYHKKRKKKENECEVSEKLYLKRISWRATMVTSYKNIETKGTFH